MFDEKLIQQLKQTNISTDGDKTKQRVKEIWNTASKEDKQTIEKLAGITRSTVYRIYNTGSISAKLAVPIAQTLNVSPYYLTGETDEQGECSNELLEELLKKHGYEKLLLEQTQPKTRQRRNKAPGNNATPPQETPDEIAERFDKEIREELSSAALEYKKEHDLAQAAAISEGTPVPSDIQAPAVSDDTRAFLDGLTEDDMILLLRSIILRAKSGLAGTAELAEKLKLLLLS